MVYPPAAQLLREHLTATNWSLHNHYHTLTLPSRNLLDFPIPPGLNLSLSNRPLSTFSSALSLTTLVPSAASNTPASPDSTPPPPLSSRELLTGQLTYVYSSAPLSLASTRRLANDKDKISVQEVVQSFRVPGLPVRPELRDDAREHWHRGNRVQDKDFLLYGKLYAPSPRLDALIVRRHSPTLQSLVSLITVPSPLPTPQLTWAAPDEPPSSNTVAAPAETPSASSSATRMSELEVKIQQDYGRWSAEYSYAFGDGMYGARGMWNFGRWGSGEQAGSPSETANSASTASTDSTLDSIDKAARVVDGTDIANDTNDVVSTGLKGRWSAGGEAFFSAQERAAGMSTAIRFTTLPPDPSLPATIMQPPTCITATLNPIMGQLSAAYAVGGAGRDGSTALATRFDFNLYSYDAEVTIGGEWFLKRKRLEARLEADARKVESEVSRPPVDSFDAFGRDTSSSTPSPVVAPTRADPEEIIGVLKARASTSSDVALLWEGRLGDFLVSLGIRADLRLTSQRGGKRIANPVRSLGVGIQYWG